jgi:hypothetical protein
MGKVYKSLSKNYPYNRCGCIKCGKLTTHKVGKEYICKDCAMGLEENVDLREQEIAHKINKSRLTLDEIDGILKQDNTNYRSPVQPFRVEGKYFKIGVISDTHIGSKFYDPEVMKYAAKVFKERDVDFVVHAGDVTEGHYENKRQGSVFELTEIGGDAQEIEQ